jgi:hypothetical protein
MARSSAVKVAAFSPGMVRRSTVMWQWSGWDEVSWPPLMTPEWTRPLPRTACPGRVARSAASRSSPVRDRRLGDGVDSEVGAGAVRGDAGQGDLGPDEPLVAGDDVQAGGLGDKLRHRA